MRGSREAGAALVVTLVTITALLVLGALTVRNMRAEPVRARTTDAALYAAESGVAAAVQHLRGRCPDFSPLVEPKNHAPQRPAEIAGNGVRPGAPGNLFDRVDPDADSWYEVTLLNNPGDPGLDAGDDTDGVLVVRAVGHGPGRTSATVEVEVRADCAAGRVQLLGWRQVL